MRTSVNSCLNISNKTESWPKFWEFVYLFTLNQGWLSTVAREDCLQYVLLSSDNHFSFWFSFTLDTSNLCSFGKYSEFDHFVLSRKSFKWTNHFSLELRYAMSNWKHIFSRYLGGLSPCFLCRKEFTLSLFFDYLMIVLPLLSSMLHWSQLFAKNGI